MIFYAVLAPVALFMLLWALYFKPPNFVRYLSFPDKPP